jgi:hypothetical protein
MNDVKFNIVLSDWTFCDPCRNSRNQTSSAFIDVAVVIKGRGGAPEQEDCLFYNIDRKIPLDLSNRVNVDRKWRRMPNE